MSAIERAAEAFYEDPNGITSWSNMARVEPDLADRYRAAMTRAFESIDVDELARVIERASDTWWNDLSDDGPSVGEYGAAAVKAWLTGDESDE